MKRATVLMALLLIALPGLAAPEKWWDAYKRGVAAVNARNYEVGADALQRAISEMPNENNAARSRNEIFIYVPHFFLGIAKFNLGDVDGALREWKTSEEQGAIQNTDYYSKLKEWVGRAQTEKLKSAKSAASGARSSAETAINNAFSSQMQALLAGGDRSETFRTGQRKLQEARDQFAKAGTDVQAYAKAGDTANQAKSLFASAAEEAKRQKAARTSAQQAAAAQRQESARTPAPQPAPVQVTETQAPSPPVVKEQPMQKAPSVAQQTAPVEQPPVESAALVDARVAVQAYKNRNSMAGGQHRDNREYQNALRRGMQEVATFEQQLRSNPDTATAKEISERVSALDAELNSALAKATARAVESSASDPKPLLESAYRAYATGDFTTAEVILSQLLSNRPLGEAYLLRGCSRYTRAMLSRKPDPLLADAERDFKSALKINRSLRLTKTAFSPKLVSFFESVRKNG